jgi:drug/metabolite transporter (DMT)-like permease
VAALIYSIYIIIGTNVMKHVSPVQSSAVIFASAGAVYGMLTFVNGAHFPTGEAGWLAVLGIIFISTIIPVNTFLAGLDRIGPTMPPCFRPLNRSSLSCYLPGYLATSFFPSSSLVED